MPSGIFNEQKNIAQHEWNKFIEIIKNELKVLNDQHEKVMVNIDNFGYIKKFKTRPEPDINYLLSNSKYFIMLDSSLEQMINILEEFKRMNNLDNPSARIVYDVILKNEKVENIDMILDALVNEREKIVNSIEMLKSFFHGAHFDIDTVIKYGKKYNLNVPALILYLGDKASQKRTQKTVKKIIPGLTQNQEDKENTSSNYFNEFMIQKNRYEEFNRENESLLDKYIKMFDKISNVILNNTEIQLFKIMMKRILNVRNNIETKIQKIISDNYSDREDILLLEKIIDSYQAQVFELKKHNDNVNDSVMNDNKKEDELDKSKVYFLVSVYNQESLIPREIIDEYYDNFLDVVKKAQDDSKKMKLNVTKNFEDKVKKTVYAVVKDQVAVSYIKVNVGGTEGIMIITASLINSKPIKDETIEVVKSETADKIRDDVVKLERQDTSFIAVQEVVRDELFNATGRVVGGNGRK